MNINRNIRHLAHISSFTASPIVYLTVTTYGRRLILNTDWAHEILHAIWAQSSEKNDWYVGDYLLMPDHLHCFARCGRKAVSLKQWMKMWKSLSARKMIRLHDLKPPIWQADYFDRYLRSSESYTDKWNYVKLNPVRAGMVKDAHDWPFQGRIYALSIS
jgi:REP element-mobilizing transposase RayT